jgi:hypothetical protein
MRMSRAGDAHYFLRIGIRSSEPLKAQKTAAAGDLLCGCEIFDLESG